MSGGRLPVCCAILAVLAAGAAHAASAPAPTSEKMLVLTAGQATYSIAAALVEGTRLEARNVVAANVRMARQERYLEDNAAALRAAAEAAVAVVTMRSVWSVDPLFPHARRWNIRIVEIDAATPLDAGGVSVALLPAGSGGPAASGGPAGVAPAPYIWLNPANALRMSEIVAADLRRLSPADGERIEANARHWQAALLSLKAEYERRLAAIDIPAMAALTRDFDYLLTAFNLNADRYFLEPQDEWAADDYDAFRKAGTEMGLAVVLHRWRLAPGLRQAVESARLQPVMLETFDPAATKPGMAMAADGYLTGLRNNLEALAQALAAAARLQEPTP